MDDDASQLPNEEVPISGPTPNWRVMTVGASGLTLGLFVLLVFGPDVFCTIMAILLVASVLIRSLLNSREAEIAWLRRFIR